jgi:membrane protease YdiL (CAAX protease family)
MPWGPRNAALGVGLLFVVTIATIAVTLVLVELLGHDYRPDDPGDLFDKSASALRYADERQEAAARGLPIPDPPELTADVVSARVAYGMGMFSSAGLALAGVVGSRRGFRMLNDIGLNPERIRWSGLWLPILMTIAAYVMVVGYVALAEATGMDLFIPAEQTSSVVMKDDVSFLIFGVLAVFAAPVSEEIFYRGLIFGGFARWGFWTAALASGGIFAVSHVDPGLFLPFTIVGMIAAWLFWRERSVWPNVFFHTFFNGTSFVLMAISR